VEIPSGFRPLFRTSPVLELIGPLYGRGEGVDLVIGLRVEAKHCNARGTIHGGILATLADVALGYTMAFATTPPTALVTANLTLDFAGTAKIGDWLETHVDVQRQGSRLSFANCYITVGSDRIVRASAVFLVAGQLDAGAPSA
jgi:acyl-coenzyme A thioesterase 13